MENHKVEFNIVETYELLVAALNASENIDSSKEGWVEKWLNIRPLIDVEIKVAWGFRSNEILQYHFDKLKERRYWLNDKYHCR